jgi:phosphoribosylanthranilate isomerase
MRARAWPALEDRIQVAGIRSLEEGRMLADCGVDLFGFPLRLPVHAPDLSEDDARDVMAALGPSSCVLITYEEDPDRLVELCRFLNVGAVQLHSSAAPDILARIRERVPSVLIKSYVVRRESCGPAGFVRAYSGVCDAFITDTFDPDTGASGATGRVHDWAVSAEFVRLSPLPVILAGGLNQGNVRRAILETRPAAVDAHTGVEGPDGSKDPDLVRAFVREARAGFAALRRP